MTTPTPSQDPLPRTLVNRWRLGCIILAASLSLNLLYLAASLAPSSATILIFRTFGPLIANIIFFASTLAQFAILATGIWLITSNRAHHFHFFYNVLRWFPRILVLANAAAVIPFQIVAATLITSAFNHYKLVMLAYFLVVILLNSATSFLLYLWLFALAKRLNLSAICWQFLILALVIPPTSSLRYIPTLVFFTSPTNPIEPSFAMLISNISSFLNCLALLWSITLLLLLARSLTRLRNSQPPAFEITPN